MHARDRAVVEVLLECGADINKKSEWPAGGSGVLDRADDATAAFLVGRGAVVDVHAAAWLGDLERVRALDLGFDPHVCGVHDSSPLDRAACHGFDDVIGLLLARDPDPPLHERNEFGGTPLGACLYGAVHGWRTGGDYPASVELLLDAGSDAPADPHPVAEIEAVLARYRGRSGDAAGPAP